MLFELESVNNFSGCHWIWMKFGEVHGECVQIQSCKNELNLRSEKKKIVIPPTQCVFSAKKVNFWVTYNFSLSPWIPSKLGSSHSHCVYIQPCENGQNLRNQKNIIYFGVFTEKSLRSVTLGSLITIMNDHEFQPNLT